MLPQVTSWVSQPFTEDMNLWKWFLFLAVMVTFALLWMQILHHMLGEE